MADSVPMPQPAPGDRNCSTIAYDDDFAAPIPAYISEGDGTIRAANQALCDLLGYKNPTDLQSQNTQALYLHHQDFHDFRLAMSRLARDQLGAFCTELMGKQGDQVPVVIQARRRTDTEGKTYYSGYILRRDLYEDLLNSLAGTWVLIDSTFAIRSCSSAGIHFLGLARNDLLRTKVTALARPCEAKRFARFLTSATTRRTRSTCAVTLVTFEDVTVPCRVVAIPTPYSNELPTAVYLLLHNLTITLPSGRAHWPLYHIREKAPFYFFAKDSEGRFSDASIRFQTIIGESPLGKRDDELEKDTEALAGYVDSDTRARRCPMPVQTIEVNHHAGRTLHMHTIKQRSLRAPQFVEAVMWHCEENRAYETLLTICFADLLDIADQVIGAYVVANETPHELLETNAAMLQMLGCRSHEERQRSHPTLRELFVDERDFSQFVSQLKRDGSAFLVSRLRQRQAGRNLVVLHRARNDKDQRTCEGLVQDISHVEWLHSICETVLGEIQDPAVLCDAAGTVRAANKSARALFLGSQDASMDPELTIGDFVSDSCKSSYMKRMRALSRMARRMSQSTWTVSHPLTMTFRLHGGEEATFQVVSRVFLSPTGVVILSIARDARWKHRAVLDVVEEWFRGTHNATRHDLNNAINKVCSIVEAHRNELTNAEEASYQAASGIIHQKLAELVTREPAAPLTVQKLCLLVRPLISPKRIPPHTVRLAGFEPHLLPESVMFVKRTASCSILRNLIENALDHGTGDGIVFIRATLERNWVCFLIRNQCCNAEAALKRIRACLSGGLPVERQRNGVGLFTLNEMCALEGYKLEIAEDPRVSGSILAVVGFPLCSLS